MSVDELVDSSYEICKTRYDLVVEDYIQKADEFEENEKNEFRKRVMNEIKQIKYRTIEDVEEFVDLYCDDLRKKLEKLKARSRLTYWEVLSRKEADMEEFAAVIQKDRATLL